MHKNRFIIYCLSLLTLFFLCWSPPEIKAQENTSQAISQKGLSEAGVLKVGMEANYAPFNWTQGQKRDGAWPIANASGEFANGYDLQMAKKLADQLDLKLEIYKIDWDALPVALEAGKIDAVIAGMSPTAEREKQLDFSDSYYHSDIVIVTLADSPYSQAKQLKDLKGAKLTGQLNTFHYELLDQVPGVDEVPAMQDFPTMISAVTSGKIDGYISERPGALAAVAANSDLTLVEFNEGEGFDLGELTTDVAIAVRKNSPLRPAINDQLAKIPGAERQDLMEDMVVLNERGESHGFWSEVRGIWTDFGGQFLKGAANTMLIALSSTLLGFLLGLAIAVFRSIPDPKNSLKKVVYAAINLLITVYIEIFRGTPMMVQAMLIFYGSKLFLNWDMSTMFAAIFIVSINTGAYLSEVIRGGIMGVDSGQQEAAQAIGMNHFQQMTTIILPQAIRQILPALGNEFVINIKDTSVLNVIAVTELFFVTRSTAGSTYLTFQTFFITSIIYFVLTFTTTRLLHLLEKHLTGSKHYRVHTSSTMADQPE